MRTLQRRCVCSMHKLTCSNRFYITLNNLVFFQTSEEPSVTSSSRLKASVKGSQCRLSRFLIYLFLFLLFLIPFLLLLCVAHPDYCALPGPCPGLQLRQRINFYIQEFHRKRIPHYPI
ncbi:unnamed protein product [Hymenolepis diminuta]|uniref:Uncharacterized protein n=1 Tax=Hymenolepis diminuta TaxID=6216 RepID=A0A564YRT2_HYMDI|nr:unnamed protein product [Hymenolepis diminuta]